MRAHVLTKYGSSNAVLSWSEVPTAPLRPGEVRVEVEAVALNPVDLKTRVGEPKLLLPMAPPFVLGSDLAGKVVEVGDGVTTTKVGDLVFAYAGMDRMGAFAEWVTLPAARVARRPAQLSAAQAACLPLPGLCALQALDLGKVGRGSRVLIHGGVGGVGSLAVQLAHQRGAEVFATVGPGDLERARGLGVSHPIDYRAQRFEDVATDLDFVFDTVGGETLARSWACVKRGGTVASLHVPPPAEALRAAGLRAPWFLRLLLPLITRGPRTAASKASAHLVPILSVPSAEGLARLCQAVESAGLAVTIDTTLPLDALGAAFERLESGKARGRVVLTR
ncbi:MAG: NADP-dependent oxidoreductase [Myxococcaceae bacterium]|nr:NADP-dependent oxidoreductase [Myxococcaceae bacterium]